MEKCSWKENRYGQIDSGAIAQMKRGITYVTTPIYYVNAVPHIGHLYSTLLADAYCRWTRLKDPLNVAKLITGTDEHGIKVQKAAEVAKEEPQRFCDQVSSKFKGIFELFGIEIHDYVRTSEKRHYFAVQHIWDEVSRRGYISKGYHEGWYDKKEEAFVPQNALDSISSEYKDNLEWVNEENYKFSLKNCHDHIQNFLARPNSIYPPKYASSVQDFRVQDELSVSRISMRASWAIPVPGDSSQTIYVWFDALANYLTSLGYPNEKHAWKDENRIIHVVGKDILRFHSIYWIAFLAAAGLKPPNQIICHGHWKMNDVKMSKSLGNVISPCALAEVFGIDASRYFLFREGHIEHDSSFSWKFAQERINSEVVDTLGNLLSRSCRFARPERWYPAFYAESLNNEDCELMSILEQTAKNVATLNEDFQFAHSLEAIMDSLRATNKYFAYREPWSLVKSEAMVNKHVLENTLYLTFEALKISAVLLSPFVPELSNRVLDHLGFSEELLTLKLARLHAGKSSGIVSKKMILLKRFSHTFE